MPEDKKCLIPPQKLQQLEPDQPPLIFPGKQRPHGGESKHLILEIYFRWTVSNFKNPVGKHASIPTNQSSKGEQMQKERHTEHRLPASLLRSKFSQLALCTLGALPTMSSFLCTSVLSPSSAGVQPGRHMTHTHGFLKCFWDLKECQLPYKRSLLSDIIIEMSPHCAISMEEKIILIHFFLLIK